MNRQRAVVLKVMVSFGNFGEGVMLYREVPPPQEETLQDSQIHHYLIRVKRLSGRLDEYPIVMKQHVENETVRNGLEKRRTLANEITMYKDVIPFLQFHPDAGTLSPKLIFNRYDSHQPYHLDLLIVEDLRQKGYSVPSQKLFLDFQHLELAVKKLGQFHGGSYRSKDLFPLQFTKRARRLKILKYKYLDRTLTEYKHLYWRGLLPHTVKEDLRSSLNELAQAHTNYEICKRIYFEKREPFSVAIHGDLYKNNILYSYDRDGNPIDCAFFNFEQAKYASPALDLSFFLYMHTTVEMRERHWDELILTYWNAVEESCPDTDVPSYIEFLEEFAKMAVYGYSNCVVLIPKMLAEQGDVKPFEETINMEADAFFEYFNELGGPEASQVLEDIVKHLYEKNYVEKFLEHVKILLKK